MLEQGLVWLLSNAEPITRLIGTPDTRADGVTGIFPALLPEASSLPAIVYLVIAGNNVNSMDGTNTLNMKRVQFDVYAKGYATVKLVAQALKEVLLGFRGPMDGGTTIDSVSLNLEVDMFEEAPFVFRMALDFEIWSTDPITEPFPVPEPPPDLTEILDGGTFD